MSIFYGSFVPLLFCFCILIKALLAEGCSVDQQGVTTLTAPNGTVTSHDASKPLPSNATCQWLIKAPQGKVLRLEVRIASFRGSCDEQYLKIYDGPSATSKMIVEYCDQRRSYGDYFISSNQSLWLEMKTGIWRSSFLSWSYQQLDKEECSINTTLYAPQWPLEHNFSSPYWPHGYRINSTCGWYVKAPRDQIVKLHIPSELFDFHLDKALQVYDVQDGELTHIHLPRRYRPRRDRGIVFSKLQGIYVLFKTHDLVHSDYQKGLFVSYTAISPGKECSLNNTEEQNMNIMLKNSPGILKTPGFPNNYPHIIINECVWKIVAPTGNVVKVEFSFFQLYEFDCVIIVDGINTAGPVIDRHCGSQVSFTVYSSGPEITIKTRQGLYTDTTGPGFIANYTMIPGSLETCNMSQKTFAHLSGEGKTFYTPDFPANPGRGTCSWNITVPDGMFVKLTLQAEDCDQTSTEVLDGPTFFSRSLGTFCSQNKKVVVYSSGKSLVVRFNSTRTDSSNSGLLAWYEALSAVPASYACSENTKRYAPIALKGMQNTLASYDFPLSYPNGAKCLWKIQSPVGYVIQIKFDAFNLQNSDRCHSDYVEARESRGDLTSTLIGRFCGTSRPGVITSNYSTLLVEFVSDMSGRYPGFRATAMARPNPAMGACKVQGVDNVIRLTNKTGRLFSPLFPLQYPKDMTCTWIITVPEGHFVRLRIKSFQLSVECADSHLEIRDGDSSSSKLLNKFCFRKYDISVFSSGQYMWVRFKSVRTFSYELAGFNAVFEAVTQVPASFACTASSSITRLTSDSGILASYNYPLHYDDPIQCVWIIHVSDDQYVKLSFDFFNVSASSSSCEDDYVEVRDGQFDTSTLVGKYCGSEKPPEVTSSDWDLRVEFHSSGKARYPGFKATYETKKTIGAIMKIVGIVVGVLAAVCLVIGACCKYCWSRGDHAIQQTEGVTQTESIPLHESDTKA